MSRAAQRAAQNIQLASVDDLFGLDGTETASNGKSTVIDLPASDLHSFHGHPFKVIPDDEAMLELIESIRENGVLMPLDVRSRDEGGYEIISGHRRRYAATQAGLLLPIHCPPCGRRPCWAGLWPYSSYFSSYKTLKTKRENSARAWNTAPRSAGLLHISIKNNTMKGLVKRMDFFVSGIDMLQKLVVAIDGGLVVVGLVQFMLAQKDHDAGGKSTAVNMTMGGGGLTLIGMILVPMLKTLFT